MSNQPYYGGIIWTTHALERLKRRGLPQDWALQTFKHPDQSSPGNQSGSMIYEKKFDKKRVSVIAKQNEKNEWIILSCWIDPPMPGSPDAKEKEVYRKYQKASGWKKMLLIIKQQLGW